MEKIRCINCNALISLKEIKKGTHTFCECGCIQVCLEYNELISKWRVVNSFNFEDKRNK